MTWRAPLALSPNRLELRLARLQYRVKDGFAKGIAMRSPPAELERLDDFRLGNVKVQVEVLNSLFSTCGVMQGPHPDVLYRKEPTILKQNNSKAGRRAKWWTVLAYPNLLLFRNSGEQVAKVELNLRKLRFVRRLSRAAALPCCADPCLRRALTLGARAASHP